MPYKIFSVIVYLFIYICVCVCACTSGWPEEPDPNVEIVDNVSSSELLEQDAVGQMGSLLSIMAVFVTSKKRPNEIGKILFFMANH